MLALTCGGNLGQDPEIKVLPSGSSVTTFSIAVAGYDSRNKVKTTTWVRTTVWGDRGEQLARILSKGDKVIATGIASLSTWTDRDGNTRTSLELKATDVAPMGRSSDAGGSAGGGRPARTEREEPGKPASAAEFDSSDDIPFIKWSNGI